MQKLKVSSVIDLHLAEVKPTMMESSDNLCDVKFSGTLKISKLRISGSTKVVFKNLIAFEQYHHFKNLIAFVQYYFPANIYYMCHYIRLMNFLIDTYKDVNLLVEKEIVENWMSNSNHVSNMINKLALSYLSHRRISILLNFLMI